MKEVITVWFLGSNASGKTTQAKAIHRISNVNLDFEFITKDNKNIATVFEYSSHVGELGNNQCTGTDTLPKKELIEYSYNYLLNKTDTKLIVIDGIMATATWIDFLKNDKSKLYVVLIDFEDVSQNIERVVQRRIRKNPDKELQIIEAVTEKTMLNLESKIKGFRSMFEKASKVADLSRRVKFDDEDISKVILNDLINLTN
jgi:adenylate kinase family enzyme